MFDFTGRERRKFVRVGVELEVGLHVGDLHVTDPAVFARDISTGGLGIVVGGGCSEALGAVSAVGKQIEVEIDIPGSGRKRIPCRIAWSRLEKQGDRKRLCLGLRFLEVGPALEALVKSLAYEHVLRSWPDARSDG